jgi:hypothetical protein
VTTAHAILADLIECGIEPGVTPDETGIVVPVGKLTDEQRTAVLSQKPALIACILESARVTTELLQAAMRRCDQFNDSEKARQDMREQILETPPHLRQDLLDHFMGRPPNLR